MAWDWPIATFLFGGVGQAANDWWKKYWWVVVLIIVLFIALVIAYVWRAFK
jgi:hypothetical protein